MIYTYSTNPQQEKNGKIVYVELIVCTGSFTEKLKSTSFGKPLFFVPSDHLEKLRWKIICSTLEKVHLLLQIALFFQIFSQFLHIYIILTFSFSSDLVRFFNKNFRLASWGWPLLKNKFLKDSTRLTLRLTVTSGGRCPPGAGAPPAEVTCRSACEDAAVCCDHVSSARLIMSSWLEQMEVGLWMEGPGLGGVTTYWSFSEVGSLILIWSNLRPTRRPQVDRPEMYKGYKVKTRTEKKNLVI